MLEYIIIFLILSVIFFYQFYASIAYGKFTFKAKTFGPLWTQFVTYLAGVFFITGYALSFSDIFLGAVHTATTEEVLVKVIGWMAIILSQFFYLASQSHLGDSWNAEIAVTKKQKLVRDGIYKYLRHPMYTSFIILSFGLYIVSASLASFCFVIWALLLSSRFFEEERLLSNKYGKDYEKYRKETGAFMPKPR